MRVPQVGILEYDVMPFRDAWQLQREVFDRTLRKDEAGTLLLLEHPHVFTLGRVTDHANVLLDANTLFRLNAEAIEIDRGGVVTYHGPGQLVGYPILNLTHFKQDLGWYLRSLEQP